MWKRGFFLMSMLLSEICYSIPSVFNPFTGQFDYVIQIHSQLTSTGTKTHAQIDSILNEINISTPSIYSQLRSTGVALTTLTNGVSVSTPTFSTWSTLSSTAGALTNEISNRQSQDATIGLSTAAIFTAYTTQDGLIGSATAYILANAGGGVSISTFVAKIICGMDVFIASGVFIPNPGAWIGLNEPFPITITGISFETVLVSTVGSTNFNIAYSSATGSSLYWQYIHSADIEVATNTMTNVGGWIVPNQCPVIDTYPCVFSLHTKQIPASGVIPCEYIGYIRYFRKL